MRAKIRTMLVVLGCMVVVTPGVIVAQEENWACEEGPNDILVAAEAALDDDDLTLAWELAARAEALCRNDVKRHRQASTLRLRVENRQGFEATLEPGKVALESYSLFMTCKGEGSPTVLFENGFGMDFLNTWTDVQPAISTFTRACAYNRLGIFLSDDVPEGTIRTTQDQVDDLVALLEAAHIEPPYILVGHSIAGYNILLFADQYPDRVQGVVLVDATHPEWDRRYVEIDPEFAWPAADDRENVEHFDFAASAVQAGEVGGFGDRPLVVLTAGINSDDIWWELQNDYAALSTNSRHITAEHSGHFITDREPALVIDAILWVLDEARATTE